MGDKDEGWLYLCTMIDLFSRRVVGWTQSKKIKANMVARAIQMEIDARRPDAGIIFHFNGIIGELNEIFHKT